MRKKKIRNKFSDNKNNETGPKGFDPLTIGLEVQHSIHAELQAQKDLLYLGLMCDEKQIRK